MKWKQETHNSHSSKTTYKIKGTLNPHTHKIVHHFDKIVFQEADTGEQGAQYHRSGIYIGNLGGEA